jgi:hypothetical protein
MWMALLPFLKPRNQLTAPRSTYVELTPTCAYYRPVNTPPESGSLSEKQDRAAPPRDVCATAHVKSCTGISESIQDDTCIQRLWHKLCAVSMEPPLVREFERYTPSGSSLFSRNCQTLGVPSAEPKDYLYEINIM